MARITAPDPAQANHSGQSGPDLSADMHSQGFPSRRNCCAVNVGPYERLVSLAAGTALTAYGLFRAQRGRLPLAILGVGLAGRGLTGRCQMYRALGINATGPHERESSTVVPAGKGGKVEQSIVIDRPAEEIYAFWRDLKNLPLVMRSLQRVDVIDSQRSHWVAEGLWGHTVEWDAEIFNDRAGEVIAWRSLPGGDVDTAGSVHFKSSADGRQTEVTVSLKYDPPAGRMGVWMASFLGEDLAEKVAADLHDFKSMMEAGDATLAHRDR